MLQGEHSAILLTFVKLSFVIKIFVLSFLMAAFNMDISIKVRFFSQPKRMGQLGPLPWKVMGHILKSWDNDPGPP